MSEVPSRLAPLDDYMNSYTQPIRLDPQRTILVVVDMQYASGCRTEGLGRRLIIENREGYGKERFDRIEQVVVANLKRLLAFFRERHLPVLYLVIGSEHPELLDIPRHMRRLVRATMRLSCGRRPSPPSARRE